MWWRGCSCYLSQLQLFMWEFWLMDFEEYVSANYKRLEGQTRELVEDAFKAGQQSKQAEIDALEAKIDDLVKWAELHIKEYNSSESNSEHDRGWFNAACQVFKSLKGESK